LLISLPKLIGVLGRFPNRYCNEGDAARVTGRNDDARVQAFYRDVNERIASISRDLGTRALEILCECGTPACTERVRLAAREYERIRGSSTHFAVLRGHENPAVEDVVRASDEYFVVANYGAAATVARRTDPRASSR
jgi:hypothetical protein